MPQAPRWVSDALSPYRIPLLLVLSGMLLRRSLAKPVVRYYWGKFSHVGWPYLVWCCILLAVSGSRYDATSIWFWMGGSYLWYLVVIGACYALGPIVRWIPPGVVAIGMIILLFIWDPSTNAVIRVLENGPYFFAGVWAAGRTSRILSAPVWLACIVGAGAVTWGAYSATVIGYAPRIHPVGTVTSLLGVFLFAWLFSRVRSSRPLEWAGRHSLVLYVAHFPVMVLLLRSGVDALPSWVVYFILLATGIGVPVLQGRYASTSVLFRLPEPRTNRSMTANRSLQA